MFLGKRLDLRFYTDSKSLFDSLISLNTTTENILLIDLSMLCEFYQNTEITEVLWIPGDQNPADWVTKSSACNALETLLKTNKIKVTPSAWIERTQPSCLLDFQFTTTLERVVDFKVVSVSVLPRDRHMCRFYHGIDIRASCRMDRPVR